MPPIWSPSPQRAAAANLSRFMACVNARQGLRMANYDDLYRWSIDKPAQFWVEVARFADLRASFVKDAPVIDNPNSMPGARFFAGARLNFAENLLRYRDAYPALVFRNERGARCELSYRQLHDEVARVAAGLIAAGVVAGDRVAAFLPNLPETAIAMLATASIGAIWSSCSPDFGVGAVIDRFGQIAPKVLFTTDGYFYAGKTLDSLTTVAQLLQKLPSVRALILVPYVGAAGALARIARRRGQSHTPGKNSAVPAPHCSFLPRPFDHPLYILYSSGTTGAPKCIVHGAGGTLLQHQKEHVLHTDVRREDRIFYFTTCGWMMWNWLMSAPRHRRALVLYDGSPFHPDPGVLWRMAAEERLTIFGTSAKYLGTLGEERISCRRAQSIWVRCAPSSRPARRCCRTASTSSIATSRPTCSSPPFPAAPTSSPVSRSAARSGPCIAARSSAAGWACVWRFSIDADGRVRGARGELVCTAPFPSMPVGFWGDADGDRYRAAYFERFPGVWHHADYAELTEHDGLIIYGRSDAVLNPGGVRIGTAELYSAVEGLAEIAEALAVGQDWQGDVRIVLFVRLQPGYTLDAALVQEDRARPSAIGPRRGMCRRRSLRFPSCRARSRASSPNLRCVTSFMGSPCPIAMHSLTQERLSISAISLSFAVEISAARYAQRDSRLRL